MKGHTMIRLEDKAFEDSIIKEHYHIAVPFQITVYADRPLSAPGEDIPTDGREFLVYSFAKDLAKEFDAAFADALSEDAIDWLTARLAPLMEGWEYDSASIQLCGHREYRLTPADLDTLPKAAIDAELLTVLTDADRMTDADLELDAFEMDGSNPNDAMTVIRENGQIVCFAAVNDILENDTTGGLDWIELNVECGEAWRKKGYGAACVTALTRHYLQMGKGVKYLCDEDNLPSIRTAEKVGYRLYSRVMPLVYYTYDEDVHGEDCDCDECRHSHND